MEEQNNIIEQTIKVIEERKQKVLELKNPIKLCNNAKQLFPNINLQNPFIEWQYDCHIVLNTFVDRYSDMGPLFEYFAKNGWYKRIDSNMGEGPSSYHYWQFVRDLDGGYSQPTIEVDAYFQDSETACKWIKIGTKETPVYKITCPDGSEDIANETL